MVPKVVPPPVTPKPAAKVIPIQPATLDLSGQAKAVGEPVTLADGTRVTRLSSGRYTLGTGVTALVLSPTDEDLAVTADDQGTVLAIRLSTGEVRRVFAYPGMAVRRIRFTPNGQRLVGIFVHPKAGEDVVVLDVRSGQVLRSSPTTQREYLALDPTGRRVLRRNLVDREGKPYTDPEVWREAYAVEDLDSGETWPVPLPTSLQVEMVSPGQFILAGKSGEVGWWTVGEKARRKTGFGLSDYQMTSLSPTMTGPGVYLASKEGPVTFQGEDVSFTLPSQGHAIEHVADCLDRSRAVLVDTEGVLHVVETGTGTPLARLQANPITPRAVGLSASGRRVAWVSDFGRLETRDLAEAGKAGVTPGHVAQVTALAEAGRTLVSGAADGTIRIWDLAAGKERDTLPIDAEEVASLTATPDATRIVAGYRSSDAIVGWNATKDGYVAEPLAPRTGAVSFSRAGALLVAANRELQVWRASPPGGDAGAWGKVATLADHYGDPAAAAWAGAGVRVLGDDEVRLLSVDADAGAATAAKRPVYPGNDVYQKASSVFAWGRDAAWVVVGRSTGWLARMDFPETPTWSFVVPAHRSAILAVATAPDGRLQVSAGEDGTVAVWSAEGQRLERHDLSEEGDVPTAAVFVEGGKRFAVGTRRGRLLLFRSPPVPAQPSAPAGSDAGVADGAAPSLVPRGELGLPSPAPGTWQRAIVIPNGDRALLGDGTTVVQATLNARGGSVELAAKARLLAVSRAGQAALVSAADPDGHPALQILPLGKRTRGQPPTFPGLESDLGFLSPEGGYAVACGKHPPRWLDGRRSRVLGEGPEPVDCLAWHPAGQVLLFRAGTVPNFLYFPSRTRRALELPLRQELAGEGLRPQVAEFSPDGRIVVIGTPAGTLEIYDVPSASWGGRIPVGGQPVVALGWGKGDRLAAGMADGRVAVVDVARGRVLGVAPQASPEPVLAVGFLKDKQRLVVIPAQGPARTFDVP